MKLYPEATSLFIKSSGRVRTPSSVQSYKAVLGPLQRAHPTLKVDQFTEAILTDYCLAGDRPAPRTIKHRRNVIRSFFEWATWKGLCEANPATSLKFTVQPGNHDVRHGHWLDERQVTAIVRACPDTPQGHRDRVILLFGFLMGLRVGDLSKLRWADLSPDMKSLTVLGKGSKRAVLGVPAQLRSELEEWRRAAPADAEVILPGMREIGLGGRELVVDWSHPLGPKGIYHAVVRAGERAGVKLAPHDMRRTFAAILEDRGTVITDIQRALRHNDVGTTSIYLDKNPRRTTAVTEGLMIEL